MQEDTAYSLVSEVDATGDWCEDNRRGRDNARRMLDFMKQGNVPSHLGHVVSRIVRKQRFCGVETGFFQALAERLMR